MGMKIKAIFDWIKKRFAKTEPEKPQEPERFKMAAPEPLDAKFERAVKQAKQKKRKHPLHKYHRGTFSPLKGI